MWDLGISQVINVGFPSLNFACRTERQNLRFREKGSCTSRLQIESVV